MIKTIPGQQYELDKMSTICQHFMKIYNFVQLIPSQRSYNLTISKMRRFVWFRVAKVGTRTIYNHLKESKLTLDVDHPYNVSYIPRLYKKYFKFAFVRNPWDRIVSSWHNKVLKGNHFKFDDTELKRMSQFENFIDYVSGLDIENCNNHLRSQCALIDLNEIDFLGRFENFEHDLRYVLERIGIQSYRLMHRNKSHRKKDYREYYNNEMKEKVYKIYQKDIGILGYQFE